jgi:hypothetical protein
MTVEELITKLQDLDPRTRVVVAERHPEGIVRGVEVIDVYEAKGTDEIPECLNVRTEYRHFKEEFLRLYRLGTKGAAASLERVVVLDDE